MKTVNVDGCNIELNGKNRGIVSREGMYIFKFKMSIWDLVSLLMNKRCFWLVLLPFNRKELLFSIDIVDDVIERDAEGNMKNLKKSGLLGALDLIREKLDEHGNLFQK
jgi:hypothetical protein